MALRVKDKIIGRNVGIIKSNLKLNFSSLMNFDAIVLYTSNIGFLFDEKSAKLISLMLILVFRVDVVDYLSTFPSLTVFSSTWPLVSK